MKQSTIELENKILDFYNQGLSIDEICLKISRGRTTIANYLAKNNKRYYKIHKVDQTIFSTFTPESCYWAGFIAADGNLSKKMTHLRIELNINDSGHLEKILKFAKDEEPRISKDIKIAKFSDGKEYKIQSCYTDINSNTVVRNIKENFGITPNKSLTIQPPTKIPEDLIVHYIRGYFDGDGSIYWNSANKSPVFSICCGSKDLLEWIANKIKNNADWDFGKKALIPYKDKIWRIRQMWGGSIKILDWLYEGSTPEMRLDRKYERYLEYKENKEN